MNRVDVVVEATAEREAGLLLTAEPVLHVVDRLPGNRTTEFGAPNVCSALEKGPVPEPELALLEASWRVLDRVAAQAPPQLRKRPRGGGRDRDAVVAGATEAQHSDAREVGVRLTPAERADTSRARSERLAALRGPAGDRCWVRRAAWHVLDHVWEIEDKSS